MTDQTEMSPEEKLGREIVARTTFEKEASGCRLWPCIT